MAGIWHMAYGYRISDSDMADMAYGILAYGIMAYGMACGMWACGDNIEATGTMLSKGLRTEVSQIPNMCHVM